jgi:hypothetical protein
VGLVDEMITTDTQVQSENKQQPTPLVQKRPQHNTSRNRMYSSKNSFNTLDFDYYDINDCSTYKNSILTSGEQKVTGGDEAPTSKTESPTMVIVKSNSSSNIAGEVQSLFKPPLASSSLLGQPQQYVTLPSQEQPHSLFRSTSSESIRLKQRFQTTAQQYFEKIRVGICAMDKKAQSQPMKEILCRLDPKGMVLMLRFLLVFISCSLECLNFSKRLQMFNI